MDPPNNRLSRRQRQARGRRASRPRKRRCLLKGCGRLFEPRRAQARYCGAECRTAAKRWRDWKSRKRYRKKEGGRRKRREQSRRWRRRQRERKRSGDDVEVAVEASAWVIAQEKRSSSCDRPGCYESFVRTRRSPLQRFCTGACWRALYRVIERERRWKVRFRAARHRIGAVESV